MRCLTMTFPALSVLSRILIHCGIVQHFTVGNKMLMTTDTVVLNNFLAGFFDEYYLGLGPQGKNCRMAYTVFGFKKVFIEEIIMRNMTVVAICFFTV